MGDTSGSTFVQMRAVVVRFDTARRFGGVDVECVQVGADVVYGAEALDGLDECEAREVEWRKYLTKQTWPAAAPVSKTLLSVERGLPWASFVTFFVGSIVKFPANEVLRTEERTLETKGMRCGFAHYDG